MTNEELLEEAQTISKLILNEQLSEALDKFRTHSTEERLELLFILHTVHSHLFKQIENIFNPTGEKK